MLQNALNDERNCRLNSGSNVKSEEKRREEKRGKREEQKRGSEICKKKPEIKEISIEKKREDPQYTREIVKEKRKIFQGENSSRLSLQP